MGAQKALISFKKRIKLLGIFINSKLELIQNLKMVREKIIK
jgi:hypothetical protein